MPSAIALCMWITMNAPFDCGPTHSRPNVVVVPGYVFAYQMRTPEMSKERLQYMAMNYSSHYNVNANVVMVNGWAANNTQLRVLAALSGLLVYSLSRITPAWDDNVCANKPTAIVTKYMSLFAKQNDFNYEMRVFDPCTGAVLRGTSA